MTRRTAAIRYARALFDVASREAGPLDRIEAELAAVVELFRQHPVLQQVLLNPAVPVRRKRAAIDEIGARLDLLPMVRKLLGLLAERDRLIVLPDVAAAYRGRLLDHRRVVRAEITTAVPLSPEQARALAGRLEQVTGRTVEVSTRVDPAILGGVVARVGGVVYDASVTRQLARLRERFVEG